MALWHLVGVTIGITLDKNWIFEEIHQEVSPVNVQIRRENKLTYVVPFE